MSTPARRSRRPRSSTQPTSRALSRSPPSPQPRATGARSCRSRRTTPAQRQDFQVDLIGGPNTITVTVAAEDAAAAHAYTVVVTRRHETVPPRLTTAAADGDQLTLAYSETLDAGSVPPLGAFAVAVTDARTQTTRAAAVAHVDVDADTVTLTLHESVRAADTVAVTYSAPAQKPAARHLSQQRRRARPAPRRQQHPARNRHSAVRSDAHGTRSGPASRPRHPRLPSRRSIRPRSHHRARRPRRPPRRRRNTRSPRRRPQPGRTPSRARYRRQHPASTRHRRGPRRQPNLRPHRHTRPTASAAPAPTPHTGRPAPPRRLRRDTRHLRPARVRHQRHPNPRRPNPRRAPAARLRHTQRSNDDRDQRDPRHLRRRPRAPARSTHTSAIASPPPPAHATGSASLTAVTDGTAQIILFGLSPSAHYSIQGSLDPAYPTARHSIRDVHHRSSHNHRAHTRRAAARAEHVHLRPRRFGLRLRISELAV